MKLGKEEVLVINDEAMDIDSLKESIARSDKPELGQQNLHLAIAYYSENKFQKALKHIELSLKCNFKNYKSWYLQGRINDKLGKYNIAIACYNESIKLSPENNESIVYKGLALFKSKKCEESKNTLLEALKRSPEEKKIQFYLGVVLTSLKEYDLALKYFKKVKDYSHLNIINYIIKRCENRETILNSHDANSLTTLYYAVLNDTYIISSWLLELGEDPNIICSDKNQNVLHLAISKSKPEIEFIRELCSYNIDYSKNNHLGRNVFDLAMHKNKAIRNILFNVAEIAELQDNDTEETIKYKFELSLKCNSKNYKSWYLQGRINDKLGKYNIAIACYNESIKLSPENNESIVYKGLALFKSNKYNEARDCLEEALKKYTDRRRIEFYLGVVLVSMQEYDLALEYLIEVQKSSNYMDTMFEVTKRCKNREQILNSRNEESLTALYYAVSRHEYNISRWLLDLGEDPNIICSKKNQNVLHLAISKPEPEIEFIRELCSYNIDYSKNNHLGRNVFDLAMHKNKAIRNILFNAAEIAELKDTDTEETIKYKLMTALVYETKRKSINDFPCDVIASYLAPMDPNYAKLNIRNETAAPNEKLISDHIKTIASSLEDAETQTNDFYGSYESDDSDEEIKNEIYGKDDEYEFSLDVDNNMLDAFRETRFIEKLKKLKNCQLYLKELKNEELRTNLSLRQHIRYYNQYKKQEDNGYYLKQELEEILNDLNDKISKGISLSQASEEIKNKHNIEFYIAQYRGIHYMTNHFGQKARRYHRNKEEIDKAQYSQSVLLEASGERSLNDLYKKEPNKSKDEILKAENRYKKWAIVLKDKLLQARYTDRLVYNKQNNEYVYDNIAHLLQDIYTKDYHGFIELIKQNNMVRQYLINSNIPFVSTGDVPYHSLKYAYGTKPYKRYEDDRLRPRWRSDGRAERPYSGKVYVSIHPITDYGIDGPNCLNMLNATGQIKIDNITIAERETSFFGFIPENRVVYHYVAKYPSFKGNYKAIYYEKYGLTSEDYNLYKDTLKNIKPHTIEMTNFKKILGEWLCAYHEVRLIEEARIRAEKKGGILVYRNEQGLFQLNVPEATPIKKTSNEKEIQLKEETLKAREFRKNLSKNAGKFLPGNIYAFPTNHSESFISNTEFERFRTLVRDNNLHELKKLHIPNNWFSQSVLESIEGSKRLVKKCTALHLAVENQYYEMSEYIVKNNIDLNVRNSNGSTALHIAIAKRNIPIIQLLIKYNAEINIPGPNGLTAIEFIELHHPDLVELLYKNKHETIDSLKKDTTKWQDVIKNQKTLNNIKNQIVENFKEQCKNGSLKLEISNVDRDELANFCKNKLGLDSVNIEYSESKFIISLNNQAINILTYICSKREQIRS